MIRITRYFIRSSRFRFFVSVVVAVLGIVLILSGLAANRDQAQTITMGGVVTLAGIALFIGLYIYQQRQQPKTRSRA